jgi:hypothetical protein
LRSGGVLKYAAAIMTTTLGASKNDMMNPAIGPAGDLTAIPSTSEQAKSVVSAAAAIAAVVPILFTN